MEKGTHDFLIGFLQYCVYGAGYGILSYFALKLYQKFASKKLTSNNLQPMNQNNLDQKTNWQDAVVNILGNIGVGGILVFVIAVIPVAFGVNDKFYCTAVKSLGLISTASIFILLTLVTFDRTSDY